ncbi:MAG: hypothetical protein L6R40_003167, partial [Gallowayella cf. fulva]
MDGYVLRKKRKLIPPDEYKVAKTYKETHEESPVSNENEDDSTDLKLARLASLFPQMDQVALLDVLISSEGSVEHACEVLSCSAQVSPRKKHGNGTGYQTSLASFNRASEGSSMTSTSMMSKPLTRKGQTLHLYAPEDIEIHTPCSIIHKFLPAQVADDLLRELLEEVPSFEKQTFKMFDNVVQSPHSACFYVESLEERTKQQTEYLYNGSFLT